MSKKTIRLISFITIVLSIVMLATTCFADVTPGQITGKDDSVGTDKIVKAGNQIATIIRTVGIVASVIILMILGIKYIMGILQAAGIAIAVVVLMVLGIKYMMGSAEEKADYKKTMIPYVVGAVILFGASAIAGAVVELAQGIAG